MSGMYRYLEGKGSEAISTQYFLCALVQAGKRKAEVVQKKSPAEFFAENSSIAGFDNVSSFP